MSDTPRAAPRAGSDPQQGPAATSADIRTAAAKPPRKLHIAHRRSPSELTTLMVEQFNLQKQLEAVQHQQQQLIHEKNLDPDAVQQALAASTAQLPRGHSRGSSAAMSHSRSGSVTQGAQGQALGHVRRHSLGIHEAKKAAAYAQAQRSPSKAPQALQAPQAPKAPPPSFKFPPDPPAGFLFPAKPAAAPPAAAAPVSFAAVALLAPAPALAPALAPPARGQAHFRSSSRTFDSQSLAINTNWRQSAPTGAAEPFTPSHRSRSSIGSFSSSAPAFGAGGAQRKSLFAPYLPQASLPELVSEGRLVVGTLRVNKKNRSDAYVSTDGLLDADIFICGSKDRNRALEGDLVAVELLVVDEVWGSKKEKEEKKRRKDQQAQDGDRDDSRNDATGVERPLVKRRGSLKQRPTQKKNDDVEVEGQSLLLVEEEEINDDYRPLYAGHVVAVVDRIPGQLFAGTLGLLRPSQATGKELHVASRPKIVWFKPTDKKVPLIAIPTEQAPKDFVDNHDAYQNKLFVASIKRWPITSLHPFGTLVSQLGGIEDTNTDIESILRDNNFLCDEYPVDANGVERYSYTTDFPDPKAAAHRVSYAQEYVVAFSPSNGLSDHAVHVKRLLELRIELGVHIADVTHYVASGSAVDKKAKKRSSLVFLAQKTAHLLPTGVNRLVSFAEGVLGLAISVVFEIDTATFAVERVTMTESTIVPKQLVTYDEVDAVLATAVDAKAAPLSSATCDYIRTVALIAREFRRHRLHRAAPLSPNLNLLNQLDDERVRLDLNLFLESPAACMMAEVMHQVNAAVAHRVHSGLGESTLLRRQPLPTLSKIEAFAKRVQLWGLDIDTSTSASLQASILAIADPVKRQVVESGLFKAMGRGKYVVAGKSEGGGYGHYYLNVPLYTHFAAPLRRYADLIVHRQLKSVLRAAPEPSRSGTADLHSDTLATDVEALKLAPDLDTLKLTAEYCNFKKDHAYSAQEQSIHLLLCQTINEMSQATGQLLCMATVVQVYESAFDVFIPEFGIEKRVHGDQLPLVRAEFDKSHRVLSLYWEKGVDSATFIPQDERQPLSYRNSIKNKFRTSSVKAAAHQNKVALDSLAVASDALAKKLKALGFRVPELVVPTLSSPRSSPQETEAAKNGSDSSFSLAKVPQASPDAEDPVLMASESSLRAYLGGLNVRVEPETGYHVQEIRELERVPVILRAEIGMALPCLTVRALNPFTSV